MKHLARIQVEFLKEAREWDEMSYDEQKKYLQQHRKSKRKLTAKPESKTTGLKKKLQEKQKNVGSKSSKTKYDAAYEDYVKSIPGDHQDDIANGRVAPDAPMRKPMSKDKFIENEQWIEKQQIKDDIKREKEKNKPKNPLHEVMSYLVDEDFSDSANPNLFDGDNETRLKKMTWEQLDKKVFDKAWLQENIDDAGMTGKITPEEIRKSPEWKTFLLNSRDEYVAS